jgi:hypothetical protein
MQHAGLKRVVEGASGEWQIGADDVVGGDKSIGVGSCGVEEGAIGLTQKRQSCPFLRQTETLPNHFLASAIGTIFTKYKTPTSLRT